MLCILHDLYLSLSTFDDNNNEVVGNVVNGKFIFDCTTICPRRKRAWNNHHVAIDFRLPQTN